jgi:hypothetical protein
MTLTFQTVFTLDGNVLTQVQKGAERTMTVTREFSDTHLKVVSIKMYDLFSCVGVSLG